MGTNSEQFFQNRDCPYFPCHRGVEDGAFNCLFCYCPLYALGQDCGGAFRVLENGIKSCEHCTVPHGPGGYARVMERLPRLLARVAEDMKQDKTNGRERHE